MRETSAGETHSLNQPFLDLGLCKLRVLLPQHNVIGRDGAAHEVADEKVCGLMPRDAVLVVGKNLHTQRCIQAWQQSYVKYQQGPLKTLQFLAVCSEVRTTQRAVWKHAAAFATALLPSHLPEKTCQSRTAAGLVRSTRLPAHPA